MTYEHKRSAFAASNVLVKHDKSSGTHPLPILPGIKKWDRAQLALYFDLFSHRFMQDQTWASDLVRFRTRQKQLPIPRYHLIDDGRASAFYSKVDRNKLLGATFLPSLSKNTTYRKITQPEPREDVTLAECNTNPDLRLRCASLDAFLQYLERHDMLDNLPDTVVSDPPVSSLPGTASTQKEPATSPSIVLSPASLNFLDIPMSGSTTFGLPIDGLDPFPNLQATNNRDHAFATKHPHADFKWALCASKGAVSAAHTDAAGFGTHVRVVLGQKIWFYAIPDSERPEACVVDKDGEETLHRKVAELREKKRNGQNAPYVRARPLKRTIGDETYTPFVSTTTGFETAAMRWAAVVLDEGDDL